MTEKVIVTQDELAVVAKVTQFTDDDIKGSAPVRVYVCHPGSDQFVYTGRWGIAALILDPANAVLFISIVDLSTKEIIIKQEIYDPFTYTSLSPNFQSFEADEFIVGLCFAENYDAKGFILLVQGMQNYVKHMVKPKVTPSKEAPKKVESTTISSKKSGFSLVSLDIVRWHHLRRYCQQEFQRLERQQK
jgi:hypothetical protein